MQITEYDKKTFENIQKLSIDKWYSIDENRKDRDKLVSSLKKFHDCYGLLEFGNDFEKFKIILRRNKVKDIIDSMSDSGRVESTISQKVDNTTTEEKKLLKSKQIESKNKPEYKRDRPLDSVEIERQRIVDKIMGEYNKKGEATRAEALKEQERLNKIKEWKNQS